VYIFIEMRPEFLVAFNCVLGIIRNVVFSLLGDGKMVH